MDPRSYPTTTEPGAQTSYTPMFQPYAYTPPSAPYMPIADADVPTELGDEFISGKKELKEQGLAGQKAQVCVLLDVSRSMQNPNKFFQDEYKVDRVQKTINRILALAFSLDDNRQIEIIPFAGKAYNIITIDRSNYKHATQLVLKSLKNPAEPEPPNIYFNLKEDTNYAAAIRAVRKNFFKEDGPRQTPQQSAELPVFAILITDGNHNDEEEEAENQFKYASHQNIFIKCFGLLGSHRGEGSLDALIKDKFEFLTNMDGNISSQVAASVQKPSGGFFSGFFDCFSSHATTKPQNQFYIDNVNFVPVDNPDKITMQQLLKEFRGWLVEAYTHRISKIPPKIDKTADFKDEGRIVKKPK